MFSNVYMSGAYRVSVVKCDTSTLQRRCDVITGKVYAWFDFKKSFSLNLLVMKIGSLK